MEMLAQTNNSGPLFLTFPTAFDTGRCQHILIRWLHQRSRRVRLALYPQIPGVLLQDDRYAVVELSSELAGLGRDDRERLFRLRLVLALPAIPQASERNRLTIRTREVVRLSIALRPGPFEVSRRRDDAETCLERFAIGCVERTPSARALMVE